MVTIASKGFTCTYSDRGTRQRWLQRYSERIHTKDAAFEEKKGIWVTHVEFVLEDVHGEQRYFGRSSMHEDDKGTLSAQV